VPDSFSRVSRPEDSEMPRSVAVDALLRLMFGRPPETDAAVPNGSPEKVPPAAGV